MLEDAYSKQVLYTYSIEHMPQSKKVLFFYAIKGRNNKPGIFERLKIQQLGRCVLLVPPEGAAEFEQFLQKWSCTFTKRNVMVAG